MICTNCNHKTNRIVVINGVDSCTNCAGLGETGGAKTHNIMTRNSMRIREQRKAYEKDLIPPHRYDRAKRKLVPNEAFIRNYPDQAKKTFTTDEFKSVGVTKLKGKT